MDPGIFSQHSSNPLEVSPSNSRNKAYIRQYARAKGIQSIPNRHTSSDDPQNSTNAPLLEEYQQHVGSLFAKASKKPESEASSKPKPRENRYAQDLVDLDEDDDMDPNQQADENRAFDEQGEEQDGAGDDEDAYGEADEEMGADDDADGEVDEEMTIYLKPREEQEEIHQEITELERAVPQLTPDYKILDRLGTGTFSSVYKAIDVRYHDKWFNDIWHGRHPSHSSAYYQSEPRPPDSKVFVAVKRIYVTSGPERIRNEILIMQDCRMCRHVSQLITAFRHEDQVVAIMPFHRNEDFRDYYKLLPLQGIKQYFRCLFRAFRDVHARGIIHRDVKPANFLFDPRTGIGTLCDFGLACRMDAAGGSTMGACLHTKASRAYPHGKIRGNHEWDVEYIKNMQKEGRARNAMASDKVGYPAKDSRPHSKANRAGTRGFRAPEVLLKCGDQSGAIDIWSAGMILLFFLTSKFPLMQSNDDVEALMEIAAIIGRRRMEKTATLHSRVFQTNVPSIPSEGMSWTQFVESLNPDVRKPRKPNPAFYPYTLPSYQQNNPPPSSSSPQSRFSPSIHDSPPSVHRASSPTGEAYSEDIKHALDLLEKLMHPESVRRITPRDALYHPFLRDPEEPEDDELCPHPFGEGVCGEYHFIDGATDDPCVRVKVGTKHESVKVVDPGEGIAIGRGPCEFHDECCEV